MVNATSGVIAGLTAGQDMIDRRRQAEIERREMKQTGVDRSRRNAAMDELVDRYGVVAGAPTEYGQLEGIEQRGTLFERGIEQEDQALQRAAAARAAATVDNLAAGGATPEQIAARLNSMPDAVFGSPEIAAQAREIALTDPSQASALLRGLSGEAAPQGSFSEAGFFTDPETGEEVYGRFQLGPDGEMQGFEEIDFQPVQPQRVDETVPIDPTGVYQRDERSGQLFLVGRRPQPRTGRDGGATGTAAQVQNAYEGAVSGYNNLNGIIEQAISQTDWGSAGSGATAFNNIFGFNQSANNLTALLDSIGANVIFDQIEQMREQAAAAGSRGTGLGQITQRELELLESVTGSLMQEQSPAQLRQNLRRVQQQFRLSMARINNAYREFQSAEQEGEGGEDAPGFTPSERQQELLNRYGNDIGGP